MTRHYFPSLRRRLAAVERERNALAKELQDSLLDRSLRCMAAYQNGLAMGLDVKATREANAAADAQFSTPLPLYVQVDAEPRGGMVQ